MAEPGQIHVLALVDRIDSGGAQAMLAELAETRGEVGLELSIAYLGHAVGPPGARMGAAGVKPTRLPMPPHLGPAALRTVRAHMARLAPDVVHTHLRYADILGGLAARSLGIPAVSTIHGIDWGHGRDALRGRLAALVRRTCAARVITVSQSARRHYLERGWDRPERLVVVPNAIRGVPSTGQGASVRAQLGVEPSELVVGLVSALRPEKAHDVAIAATARLLARFPELRLLIVGDGAERERIEALARPLGDRVLMLGERHDVMSLLDASDVALLCSHHEAFPTTVLEAMAASLPVVATRVGGIPEIVEDGATGTLVDPPPDPDRVAAALAELLDDPQRRRAMGLRGRQRFEQEFSVHRWAATTVEIYRAVLGRPASPRARSSTAPPSKRERAARLLETTGAGRALRALPTWRGVLVLGYHRITDDVATALDREVVSATPDDFDTQLSLLKREFELIDPDQLGDRVSRGRGRHVMITFDDGYRDNYETAFPVLASHGASATFFVSTGFVDEPRLSWWDEIAWITRSSSRERLPADRWLSGPLELDQPDRAMAIRVLLDRYKELPGDQCADFVAWLATAAGTGRAPAELSEGLWMTWDMVRALRAGGMTIGGHTVSHPVLARLSAQEQEAEVAGCAQRIEAELGDRMRYLSYPVGQRWSFDERTRECLRARGVECAFSFYGGYQDFASWDPYDVPRIGIEAASSPASLQAIVTIPRAFARW